MAVRSPGASHSRSYGVEEGWLRRAPRAGTPGSEGRSRGRVERAAGKRQRGLAGRRGWRWAGVGGGGKRMEGAPGRAELARSAAGALQ